MCMCDCEVVSVIFLPLPNTVAHQPPLSMEFPRQEQQSGYRFLLQGIFLTQGSNLRFFKSDQISRSVVSDSLRPHESKHTRPPCPSPTPGVHSDSSIKSVMPSSHLILWRPLPLLPPIPPSIRVFSKKSILYIRWPKYWSFSFSISPSIEYLGLISLGLTGLIFLQSKGLSRVFSNTTVQKHQFFGTQPSSQSNSYIHTWPQEKP